MILNYIFLIEMSIEIFRSLLFHLYSIVYNMKNIERIWIIITIFLSIIVIIIGFPAFQKKFGNLYAVFWTLASVAGVWLTYFIRSYFWKEKK